MQKIVAIIKPSKFEEVIEALLLAWPSEIIVSEVSGFGRQMGHGEIYQGAPYVADFVPKVMLEMIVRDEFVGAVITSIRKHAQTGRIGDGKIFVSRVDRSVQVSNKKVGAEFRHSPEEFR